MAKRVKYQLLRNYFYYNKQELMSILGVSKSTVENWVRSGLPSIKSDNRGPYFFGIDVKEFLKKEKRKSKVKSSLGEVYCCSCKCNRKFKTNTIRLIETGKYLGKGQNKQIIIKGICSTCGTKCNSFSSSNKVGEFLSQYPKFSKKMDQFKQGTETV